MRWGLAPHRAAGRWRRQAAGRGSHLGAHFTGERARVGVVVVRGVVEVLHPRVLRSYL
jgi:hypothetical protein